MFLAEQRSQTSQTSLSQSCSSTWHLMSLKKQPKKEEEQCLGYDYMQVFPLSPLNLIPAFLPHQLISISITRHSTKLPTTNQDSGHGPIFRQMSMFFSKVPVFIQFTGTFPCASAMLFIQVNLLWSASIYWGIYLMVIMYGLVNM